MTIEPLFEKIRRLLLNSDSLVEKKEKIKNALISEGVSEEDATLRTNKVLSKNNPKMTAFLKIKEIEKHHLPIEEKKELFVRILKESGYSDKEVNEAIRTSSPVHNESKEERVINKLTEVMDKNLSPVKEAEEVNNILNSEDLTPDMVDAMISRGSSMTSSLDALQLELSKLNPSNYTDSELLAQCNKIFIKHGLPEDFVTVRLDILKEILLQNPTTLH